MCVKTVVIPLKDPFFYTSFFTLFGVFIHRMTSWREMNVFEKTLVLWVLISRQTVQQLFIEDIFYPFLPPLQNVITFLLPENL